MNKYYKESNTKMLKMETECFIVYSNDISEEMEFLLKECKFRHEFKTGDKFFFNQYTKGAYNKEGYEFIKKNVDYSIEDDHYTIDVRYYLGKCIMVLCNSIIPKLKRMLLTGFLQSRIK